MCWIWNLWRNAWNFFCPQRGQIIKPFFKYSMIWVDKFSFWSPMVDQIFGNPKSYIESGFLETWIKDIFKCCFSHLKRKNYSTLAKRLSKHSILIVFICLAISKLTYIKLIWNLNSWQRLILRKVCNFLNFSQNFGSNTPFCSFHS